MAHIMRATLATIAKDATRGRCAWWLLAIPHYLVVSLFAGGWFGWYGQDWRYSTGGGLIGILVIVAVMVLAISGRYPEPIFTFVMGMNRWC